MENNPSQRYLSDFNKFAKTSNSTVQKIDTKNVVVYTRVSSKEQADNNLSLDTQRNAIEEYARRNQQTVVAYFGGTYESAKTDGRKEFIRMLDFIKKSRGKISHLLVYSLDRFSRTGGGAIKLATDLREKYGVTVFAVTQPTDTNNPSGVLHQNIQFLFSEYDNQLRKQKAMAGMKEKFQKGIWVVKPPMGYDIVRSNGERKIVVNDTGLKLKKAFEWKLQGMKNQDIVQRLRDLGVKMYHQQLQKIFVNPFYCGLVCHGMLEGQIVEGVHEQLISKEVFLQVNQINAKAPKYGVSHKKEQVEIPLKVFTRCSCCNKGLTGYVVRSKGLWYYKCVTVGCKFNKRAQQMNDQFKAILSRYQINAKAVEPILYHLQYVLKDMAKDNEEKTTVLQRQLKEVSQRIDTIEEKYFVTGEMNKELYDKFIVRYKEEQANISQRLKGYGFDVSNLQQVLKTTLLATSKLQYLWTVSDVKEKEKLQRFMFPEGIVYDRENQTLRTDTVNPTFELIECINNSLGGNENGQNHKNNDFARLAERAGFEPAIQFPVCQFSKLVLSASQPPLRF
jgi:site-specific DNA recombinase